ncbi:MAG: DinB family protein [Bacteroidota bacterium]
MLNSELSGSVKGLLAEYKKAIIELINSITPLSADQLSSIADADTKDIDCRSIQTVLAHIVFSGFIYTIEIERSIGLKKSYPDKTVFKNADQYIEQLNLMFNYCENFFKHNPDLIIEQTDNSKKIAVGWGQLYDIEQLLEHAIVHVLRHRRQIDLFIKKQVELAV